MSLLQDSPPEEGEARAGWGWRVLRHGAEVSLTLGVVVLLFVAYQYFGKPVEVVKAQQELTSRLESSWQEGDASAPSPGAAIWPGPDPSRPDTVPGHALTDASTVEHEAPFARLHVPKLGLRLVVVEGVSAQALSSGPGHYPGTAMPGEIGNFAVAGHRNRGVFFDLDELAEGDRVVAETAAAWFYYSVYHSKVVGADDIHVIEPDPDRPGATPSRPLLTMTTCDPWWSTSHRLIVQAELDGIQPKNE